MKKSKKSSSEGKPRKFTVKRLSDIENGKILPTFEEFFKLCIAYGIAENINLKEIYPMLYKVYKKDIDEKMKILGKGFPSPFWKKGDVSFSE